MSFISYNETFSTWTTYAYWQTIWTSPPPPPTTTPRIQISHHQHPPPTHQTKTATPPPPYHRHGWYLYLRQTSSSTTSYKTDANYTHFPIPRFWIFAHSDFFTAIGLYDVYRPYTLDLGAVQLRYCVMSAICPGTKPPAFLRLARPNPACCQIRLWPTLFGVCRLITLILTLHTKKVDI